MARCRRYSLFVLKVPLNTKQASKQTNTPLPLLVSALQKNAAAKMNVIYSNLEYLELAETRIRRADLTAFSVAVVVEGRTYVGVGKTKKEARCEAAEKALRHLRLWTKQDEQNKRVMLYGIEEDDPIEVVNRLRVAAGHQPYSEERGTDCDSTLAPSWGGGHPSGSGWGDGCDNTMFYSRATPQQPRFRGPDFRPPMFPVPLQSRWDNRPPAPRPPAPNQAGLRRGYSGGPSRASFDRYYDKPNREEIPHRDYDGVGAKEGGLGRGSNTGLVPARPPRVYGNAAMTRGIPRGQSFQQEGFCRTDNNTVPPAQVPGRINRFGPPLRNRVHDASESFKVPQRRPVDAGRSRSDSVQTKPGDGGSNFTLQPRSPSAHTVAASNTARVTNPAGPRNVNYAVPVSSSVATALQTTVPASVSWGSVTSSERFYGQQSGTATPVCPSTAVNPAGISPGIRPPAAEQYNRNSAWPAATSQAADYLAYYNSYLHSIGVTPDVDAYANVPVSSSAGVPAPSSAVAQNQSTFATQAAAAAAYASNAAAAAYYNAFYAAGSYTDPGVAQQMYNYFYSYANDKPP